MNTETLNKGELTSQAIGDWFDALISTISVDKLMMQTKTAPSEKEDFYKKAIAEDHDATNRFLRVQSSKYFISKLLNDYINQLYSFESSPQKLAFDLSDAKILVWAQIKDEDEVTEDALILSEARANSKFNEFGFYVSSTIVEESDRMSVPPHYHELNLNGRLPGAH